MIYVNIYGRNFEYEEKNFLYKIFGFINVPKGMIKFVDMETMKPNPESLINVCLENTHVDFSRALINSGKFHAKDLLSGNSINDEMKFIMIKIPMSPSEIQLTQENKAYTWNKLLELKGYLEKYGYLDNKGEEENESASESEEEKHSTSEDSVSNYTEDATLPRAEDKSEKTVIVDAEKVLNRIVEELKLSDASLGKSLRLVNKITMESENGSFINIYPSNVIKDDDEGIGISFKDMLAVVKMSLIVGSNTIKFTKDD